MNAGAIAANPFVRRRSTRRGFTLIELMIVICIVGILLSVLLPSFTRSRSQARLTQCCENLKGLYTAALMYAADNGGLAFEPYGMGSTLWQWFFLDDVTMPEAWLRPIKQYVPAKMCRCPAYSWAEGRGTYVYGYYEPQVWAPRGFMGWYHRSTIAPHADLLGPALGYPYYGNNTDCSAETGLHLKP